MSPGHESKNIQIMVDLTGGYGDDLRKVISKVQKTVSDILFVFTEPAWDKASDQGYSKTQAELIEDAHKERCERS